VAELDEEIFETKKIEKGLVVVEYVVVESRTVVDSPSSGQRCLSGAGVQQVGE
jgi:hypothetical protein